MSQGNFTRPACAQPCARAHTARPQLILPLSVWSSLASNREGAIRTLGLFIMVSEQAQLSSLHIYYITPTEESRACLQIEVKQGIRGRGHKRGVSAISR